VVQFGDPKQGDIPVPGDYDGVGHAELAVFRPSTGQWIIASPAGLRVFSFGQHNLADIPIPGDYDGVGHAELAVFRPSTGQWIIQSPAGLRVVSLGTPNLVDVPVEAPIGSLERLGNVGGIPFSSGSPAASPRATSETAAVLTVAPPAPTTPVAQVAPAPERPKMSDTLLSEALDSLILERSATRLRYVPTDR
jgi:hypothetical protein